MSWHKRDDDFELNPKIVAAGRDGALVFSVLLGINSRFELRGVLPAPHWNSELLRARLGVFTMPTRRVLAAIQRCVEAGLVDRTDGGELRIVGYDSEWAPRSAPTSPEAGTPERTETVGRCSRCRKPVQGGAKRCPACAEQDSHRYAAVRNADSATHSAVDSATVPQPLPQLSAVRNELRNADSATDSATAGRARASGSGEVEKKRIRSLSVHPRSTQPPRPAGAERASLSSSLTPAEPSNGGASEGDEPAQVCSRVEDLPQDIQQMLAALKPRSPQQTESKLASTDATDRALAGGVYGEEST